jgi:hypothetical protein
MRDTAEGARRLLHDRALAELARSGDRAAARELLRRHGAAAWRLALVTTRSTTVAASSVARAFAAVLAHPDRTPVDPTAPLRPGLLAATRATALAAPPAPAGVDLPIDPGLPAAFHQLPELWRAALWLTDAEELPEAQVAEALGLSVEGVRSLLDRARAGLAEQLAHEHATGLDPDCRATTEQLQDYSAERLAPRRATAVRRHLDACAACRHRLEEIDDLRPGLRRTALAAPLLLLTEAEAAWAAELVTAPGPLKLVLPGGRPMPPWAERAVAGAAAAVITLGITGAVLSGRGKGREDLVREAATEEPIGLVDGESALGDGDGLRPDAETPTDGGADRPPSPDPDGRPSPTAPAPARPPRTTPRAARRRSPPPPGRPRRRRPPRWHHRRRPRPRPPTPPRRPPRRAPRSTCPSASRTRWASRWATSAPTSPC